MTTLWTGDALDAARLQAVQPGDPNKPWWQNILEYGATRAMDSHYQSKELDRLVATQHLVGYQGADGSTQAPGVQTTVASGIGTGTLLIGGIALLAVVLIVARGNS